MSGDPEKDDPDWFWPPWETDEDLALKPPALPAPASRPLSLIAVMEPARPRPGSADAAGNAGGDGVFGRGPPRRHCA